MHCIVRNMRTIRHLEKFLTTQDTATLIDDEGDTLYRRYLDQARPEQVSPVTFDRVLATELRSRLRALRHGPGLTVSVKLDDLLGHA